ncbi:MAG: phosphatase PAP2 family protein [Candidatus Dormibacteraceae bacterium]
MIERPTFDRRFYQWLNGLPHTAYSDRYISLLSDLGEGAGWTAASIWLAALGGSRGRRAGAATTVAALGATYVAQNVLKPIFRRNRPFVDRTANVVGVRHPDHSFPSGHTAASFAAATALTIFYPRASPMLYLTAGAVGLSRIHLGHHFLSDVVGGAVVGTVIGSACGMVARIGFRAKH